MSKKILREKLIKIRKNNYKNTKNIYIKLKQFLEENNFRRKNIGGYYPINFEVDCLDILKKLELSKYKISLPVISKDNKMDFVKWSFNQTLDINNMGIPEPFLKKKKVNPDIILVPLVGFDINNFRLGYGGGFYDRYIEKTKKKKNMVTIGLSFSFQKIKKIPIDKFDKKLDFVITEKNMY